MAERLPFPQPTCTTGLDREQGNNDNCIVQYDM